MEDKIVVKADPEKTSLWISQKELSIIEAVCGGKTSKEVGIELGLTSKVVEINRYRVMKRLGCRNTPQLVRLLYREKILC